MLQRPAYLGGAAPTNLLANLSGGLGAAQPPRISLGGGRFTLIQANGVKHPQIPPSLQLDVIVVGGNPHASRMYYDGPYDATDTAPPDCFSDNGELPSADALRPQSPTCGACPHTQWTHVNANGNMVPACSTRKKVAVLVAGAGDTVYLLAIPPASLKVWKAYMAHLEGNGAGPHEIVTRITMDQFELKFDPVDWVPEAAMPMISKALNSDEPDIVCNVKDRPRTAALPAPQAQSVLAPPTNSGVTNNAVVSESPRRGRPRVVRPNETVVGAGPIPQQTFTSPPQVAQPAPGFTPPPTAPVAPQSGFIGGGVPPAAPTFGVAQVQPAPSDMEAMLAKAFGQNFGK